MSLLPYRSEPMGDIDLYFLADAEGQPELPWVAVPPLLLALGFDEGQRIEIVSRIVSEVPPELKQIISTPVGDILAIPTPLAEEVVRAAIKSGPADKDAEQSFAYALHTATAYLAAAQAPHSARDFITRANAFSRYGA